MEAENQGGDLYEETFAVLILMYYNKSRLILQPLFQVNAAPIFSTQIFYSFSVSSSNSSQ